MKIRKQEALEYHERGRRGKIEVVATKPCSTQRDLSLAYSPGVAEPCREIAKKPSDVFRYTAKGNLVAVISNGTAVLGLGDIGPLASKPVMEGKGVLFKKFADIDVYDIEVSTKDVDEFVTTVRNIAPTFGGINLEDIKAPECFEIERRLRSELDIPVFHDDQHGTAIISAAALINALEIVKKKPEKVKVVFSGAGASATACAELFFRLGVKRENTIFVDSKGVINASRSDLNEEKKKLVNKTKTETLSQAMKGADVFMGLSVGGIVTKAMVKSMARKPIVFALANPDPEISYEEAKAARPDVVMATGRSDYPNQVNNVLGFPFIFRGALDVRAKKITEEMKLAASLALAELAKQPVPEEVLRAYPGQMIEFGPDYIIPKPFDARVLLFVSPAVAKAAMESGVAREKIDDLSAYREELEKLMSRTVGVMASVVAKARRKPRRVVFPEGDDERIIQAAKILIDEKIAEPILLGDREKISAMVKALELAEYKFEIEDPKTSNHLEEYTQILYGLRSRKGLSLRRAREIIHRRNYFGSIMVRQGHADGLVSGLTREYPDTIRPALQTIGVKEGLKRVSGVYIVITKNHGEFFLADATVNIDPTAEDLAEIAISTANVAKYFNRTPRVAMLSFSNFGSTRHPLVNKVVRATEIVQAKAPDLMIDGEMQADTAVVPEILEENFSFSALKGPANVLIFPDLQSANIAYKLLERVGEAVTIGPLLVGMKKPVHVLQRGAYVEQIVKIAAMTVVEANDPMNATQVKLSFVKVEP